ncbi:hypothetical protein DL96DRAFT_844183 [Flagelloscypha sp. PMI_526]|nr:hypothetical protein DL96DRAFT_844183 [Flagelloscypha sp. PMI_526]
MVLSPAFLEKATRFVRERQANRFAQLEPFIFPTIDSTPGDSPHASDPHAVSMDEAHTYYAGLPSRPTLLYRTGEPWLPPCGPGAFTPHKELYPVFNHPIVDIWNNQLSSELIALLDTHKIRFTTIDVVRFKTVDSQAWDGGNEVSPITIWIGVFIEITSATDAHDAAKAILVLLADYQISDIDVAFRDTHYVCATGPQLVPPVGEGDSLRKVVSPITPALGLYISTRARPNIQGTMAIYLAEGGTKNRLLGLTCRHVVIPSDEPNLPVKCHSRAPRRDILVLGDPAFTELTNSILHTAWGLSINVEGLNRTIERLEKLVAGDDKAEARKAKLLRIRTENSVTYAKADMEALQTFYEEVERDWKPFHKRVLGHVLLAPAIGFGVGSRDKQYTEDWAILELDRAKLGPGFKGNILDLGVGMPLMEFLRRSFPTDKTNWTFTYPDYGLLPLQGNITDAQMRHPDMFDHSGEPCLMVVKSGNATGTTIGRANGVFSIVRQYFALDMNAYQTSMEWPIFGYGDKSTPFSEPGDSGSVIADIKGRIGGMLTGGTGNEQGMDITYATPFWWLLQRIRQPANFPNAHLDVEI